MNDPDWTTFSKNHQQELSCGDQDDRYTYRLKPDNWVYLDGNLQMLGKYPPLQPNQRLILETMMILQPKSITEAGCGNGDNLHNLSVVLPKTQLHGFDVSTEQLAWLNWRNPDIARLNPWQMDLSYPLWQRYPDADIVFSNTVLMHISDPLAYIHALTNLFYLGYDIVVLVENWETHSYMTDIQDLFMSDCLPWIDVNFYYRVAPEFGRAQMMICSRYPLKDFPKLTDYDNTLWKPQVSAPDGNIGRLPGQSAHYPQPFFRRDAV